MITVRDIAYYRCGTADLDAMQAFLTDFGMTTHVRESNALYMRGVGTQSFIHVSEKSAMPGPQGIGFLAQSVDDLHRLAAEAGVAVQNNEEPGGGSVVRLRNPDGLRVDVLYGQQTLASKPPRVGRVRSYNFGQSRTRINVRQSIPRGPCEVLRLGHVVCSVADYRNSFDWYTKWLGLRTSDTYHVGSPDQVIFAFLHCGLGQTPTDHHTVAVVCLPGSPLGIDHAAYEVPDFDDLAAGHDHLRDKNHRHAWGVGRHVEGSQIFDYWRDPNGTKIEHFTDGDLVTDDYHVTNKHLGETSDGGDGLSAWAPPLTPDFFV